MGFFSRPAPILATDDQPSYEINSFATQVIEAFKESQIEKKYIDEEGLFSNDKEKELLISDEKKRSFFANFDKIRTSIDLETNENLKDEIYQDLTSNTPEHLLRIQTQKTANERVHSNKVSGVKVRTARGFQDDETNDETNNKIKNNEIDSIEIRLLVYNLRSIAEQPKENSVLSFGLGWAELLTRPSPQITAYFGLLPQIYRLGDLHHTLTQNTQAFFQSPILPAAESGPPPEAIYASKVLQKPSFKLQAEPEAESEPLPEVISASNIKRDKVAEFEKFLKKIDPNFQITKDKYEEILSQYYEYKEYEEKFKTRKSDTLNLDPISELTKSETTLKNSISSCLQLSSVAVPTSSLQAPNNSEKAKENSNRTTSTTYQIKDN